jgi:hypothetical protein
MHQTQNSQYLIGFSYEKSARHQHGLLDKYMIFFAVLRQQRKSDVMTYFGHSSRSAVCYKAGSQLNIYFGISKTHPLSKYKFFIEI